MSVRMRGVAALLVAALAAATAGADTADLTAAIKKVGAEGAGNAEAAKAWKELAASGPEALPAILGAMDDAGPVAANWLRAAADAVGERATRAAQPLPAADLEKFTLDKGHAPAARRLAYEWLLRVDKTASDRLLPGMLLDPSHELRRDAVTFASAAAQKRLDAGDKDGATAGFRKALSGAVDQDQVDELVKALKPLGVAIDLQAHFGIVRRWHLATPFDNTAKGGFTVAYPPEKGVDLAAVYKGKKDAEVRWTAHATTDPYGKVDLNKAIGPLKGTIGYAYAVVESPVERPVQIRVGCINAVKVFLNGKEVFAREEYHHGMRLDQYVAAGTLKKGRNELLLKVCQNEQTDSWAQNWTFQARLTDAVGQAVAFTQP